MELVDCTSTATTELYARVHVNVLTKLPNHSSTIRVRRLGIYLNKRKRTIQIVYKMRSFFHRENASSIRTSYVRQEWYVSVKRKFVFIPWISEIPEFKKCTLTDVCITLISFNPTFSKDFSLSKVIPHSKGKQFSARFTKLYNFFLIPSRIEVSLILFALFLPFLIILFN